MKSNVPGILVFIMLIPLFVYSQQSHSLYFMSELSQRHQYNPSFVPKYGYIALPVLGNIQVGGKSNVGVTNFLFRKEGADVIFLDSTVNGDKFISTLNPENYIYQNARIDLFSCGFFTPKNEFLSFDLSLKETLYANLPLEFFRLAKIGLDTSTNRYDLSSIKYGNMFWIEAALGYSREVNDRLRIGGKIKLLAGLSSVIIGYDKLEIEKNEFNWSVQAKGESYLMSNIVSLKTDSAGYFSYEDYKWTRSRKPSGYGVGIDLGVVFQPTGKICLAASLEDFGFIHWKSGSIQKGVADSVAVFEGFEGVVSQVWFNTWSRQLWALRDRAQSMARFKKTSSSGGYNQYLPTTVRASAEYTFYENTRHQEARVGLLTNFYYRPGFADGEFVLALIGKPAQWFTFATTWALLQKDPNRFGLALNFSPSWINFFVASDFTIPKLGRYNLPKDQCTVNLQTGITIPLCKNKKPYRYLYVDKRY